MDTTKPFASRLDQAQFAKVSTSGERLLARTAQATAANYDAGRIHVELSNGCAFSFPVDHAQGLAGAKVADLRVIEVTAAGLGLEWPRLDADLYVYVPTLIKGVLGTKKNGWLRSAHMGAGLSLRPRWPPLDPTGSSGGVRERPARYRLLRTPARRADGHCRFSRAAQGDVVARQIDDPLLMNSLVAALQPR